MFLTTTSQRQWSGWRIGLNKRTGSTCPIRRSMNFDKLVEAAIKEAQERGEFDNLPGKGKPIDLSEYFETPEDVRMAQSVLKNAGMTSPEVEVLKEIAELRQLHEA